MTAEQQRIAIAEACGWDCSEILEGEDGLLFARKGGDWDILPSCLTDLNACHEFEEKLIALGPPALDTYEIFLLAICTRAGNRIFRATAPQRAEAFLKTIGKWTNDN